MIARFSSIYSKLGTGLLNASKMAVLASVVLAAAATQISRSANNLPARYGLTARPISKPYLRLPRLSSGKFPPLLSQTGAFKDLQKLTPNPKLIPYDLIVPFWSDGASKSRWISIPNGTIGFSPTGEWTFPNGTVFVKEFDLSTDDTNPAVKRRLETRFLVRASNGGVYGVTYKWRPDNSDADLMTTSLSENVNYQDGLRQSYANLVLPQPGRLPHVPYVDRGRCAGSQNATDESHYHLSIWRHG